MRKILMLMLLAASARAELPFEDALVLYYSFDAGQGLKIKDGSPTGNHAPRGRAAWTPGRKGAGMKFAGTPLVVTNLNNSLSIQQPSIALWVKPAAAEAYGALVYKNRNGRGTDHDDNYLLLQMGGHWRLQLEEESAKKDYDLRSETPVRAGKWQHLVAVYDGSTLRLYVDGKLDAERATGGFSPCRGPGPLEIGGLTGSSHASKWPYHGAMDELMLFNRPLSEAEVKVVYSFASGK